MWSPTEALNLFSCRCDSGPTTQQWHFLQGLADTASMACNHIEISLLTQVCDGIDDFSDYKPWFQTWHLVLLESLLVWSLPSSVWHDWIYKQTFVLLFDLALWQHVNTNLLPSQYISKGQEMVYNIRQVTTIGTGAFTHGWLQFSLRSDLVDLISWYSTPTKTQQFTPGKMQFQEAQQRFRLRITLCCRLATLLFCRVVTSTQIPDSGLQYS